MLVRNRKVRVLDEVDKRRSVERAFPELNDEIVLDVCFPQICCALNQLVRQWVWVSGSLPARTCQREHKRASMDRLTVGPQVSRLNGDGLRDRVLFQWVRRFRCQDA